MRTINRESLVKSILLFSAKKYGILIRAPHGVGKSELVHQIAEEMNLPVVERRASQMPDAGDLMGLPFQKGGVTEFLPMKWFYQACQEPVVLFFDEIGRGNMDVRQALFEIGDSRKIAGQFLHPGTIVIAADNSREGEHDYQVQAFDPAELDRWAVFDFEPTIEEWISYNKGIGVDPRILSFIRENPKHLEHKGEHAENKRYPSRRSWTRTAKVIADELKKKNPCLDTINYCVQAKCGAEAANLFVEYIKDFDKNIKFSQILDGTKIDIIPELSQERKLALCENLYDFADGIKENKRKLPSQSKKDNIAKFILRLESSEIIMAALGRLREKSNILYDAVFYSKETYNGRTLSKTKRLCRLKNISNIYASDSEG